MLDICTGLGYTAIWARRRGACHVITIEKDENVLELAAYNPWSSELFSGGISIIQGDAREVLPSLQEVFDAVLHDPPTLKLAGELYSRSFYEEISRVMKPGATFVHYVGEPGIMSRQRVYVGVLRRVRSVGFDAFYDEETRCVVARKM